MEVEISDIGNHAIQVKEKKHDILEVTSQA